VTRRSFVWLVAIAVLAVAAGLVYRQQHSTAGEPAAVAGPSALAVSVVPVKVAPMVDRVTSYGNLVAARSVNIVPDRPGQVQKMMFADGQQVAAGTPLVIMDSRIAEAQVGASNAQADAAMQNLRRTESLARQGLDSTYSLEQARSKFAASQADLSINRQKLEQLTLRAPFAGTLGTRKVDVGAFLNGAETIVRLDDTSVLQIEFRIPSVVILRVNEDTEVHVELPSAQADEAISGTLSFIDPAVSTDTRSVLLRAVVPNPGRNLRPGLFVRVSLDLATHPNALVVPVEAVVRELANAYVFVVDDKNIARRREVRLGLTDGVSVELAEGATAGERVITVGQFRVNDGDRVKIVPLADAKAGS
jgi:membrane fusion protein (multidrug efflux system)